MPTCNANGCKNRQDRKLPGITFHKFPKNDEQRSKWIKACGRQNWIPTRFSYLCSAHFSEDLMDRTSLCVTRVKENAVPNIFPAFPSCLKDRVKMKRKPPKERISGTSKSVRATKRRVSKAKDSPNIAEPPSLYINMEHSYVRPAPSLFSTKCGSSSKSTDVEHSKTAIDTSIKCLPNVEEPLKIKVESDEELIKKKRKKRKTLLQHNRRFPKNKKQRTKGIKACRSQKGTPSNVSSLCSDHFSEDQVDRTSLPSTRLRENSVPDILSALNLQSNVKMKREPPKEHVSGTSNSVSATVQNVSTAEGDANTTEEPPLCINNSTAESDPNTTEEPPLCINKSTAEGDPNTTEEPPLCINKSTAQGDTNATEVPPPCINKSTAKGDTNTTVEPSLCINKPTLEHKYVLKYVLLAKSDSLPNSTERKHSKTTVDASTSPIKCLQIDEKSLKRKVECYEEVIRNYRKKIRLLRQQTRRDKRRIEKLSGMFQELKDEQLWTINSLDILIKASSENEEFLKRHLNKVMGNSQPKTYS